MSPVTIAEQMTMATYRGINSRVWRMMRVNGRMAALPRVVGRAILRHGTGVARLLLPRPFRNPDREPVHESGSGFHHLAAPGVQQVADAAFQLVANRPHVVQALAGRVSTSSFRTACPGNTGQASPQPIVTTTSAARTVSSVHGRTRARCRCRVRPSRRRRTGSPRCQAPNRLTTPPPARPQVARRSRRHHLGTAGVVGAEEQHDRLAVRVQALDAGERAQALPGEPLGEQGRSLTMVERDANWSGGLGQGRSMVSGP